MKKLLITTFVLAASSTAFAGEYHGDDTLGWISDYHGHQGGYSTTNHFPDNSSYIDEYHGDDTLAWIGASEQQRASTDVLSAPTAIGSSEPVGILDHLFPNGHLDE